MAFTYKSRPVQRESLYQAIPDEMLMMGAKQQYDRAEKFASELGSVYNSFFGINAYGKDAEVLQQKAAQANDIINQASKNGFGSLEAQSQINNLIGQLSNDPDVLAIHQRSNFYNNELKRKQEAEDKGIKYISPGLEALENYYSSGSYYRKPEGFNMTSGFIFDLAKMQEAAQKIAKVNKKWVTLPNGERMQIETQSKEDLANAYFNLIAQDPNGQKYLQYIFEKNYPVDWESQGRSKLAQDINKLQNDIYDLNSTGGDSSAHQAELERLMKIYNSGTTGTALKQQMMKHWINNFVSDWADSVDYVNEGDIKMDELEKIKLQHALNLQEKLYQAQLDAGKIEGVPAKKSAEAYEAQNILSDLENFKKNYKYNKGLFYLLGIGKNNSTVIPGIFSSNIFKERITVPKITENYDATGKLTGKSITTSEENVSPSAVDYDDKTDTWTLTYKDGSKKTIDTEGIKNKIIGDKSSLAKYLKEDKQQSDNTQGTSLNTKEELIKSLEKRYNITRDKFPQETKQWIDSIANAKNLK